MNDIYKKLAEHLDRIPNGFPETASGVELKILAKLFTPEQAELACLLGLEPQSAKEIAAGAGRDEREIFAALKTMVKQGLIVAERGAGSLVFKSLPFVVGIYERHNDRLDEEFAQLFELYFKEAFHKVMSIKPSVHRVIPIEKSIPLNIDVLPYERASTYIENAASWGVQDCMCRVQQRLVGAGCDHSLNNCLSFSSKPNAFASLASVRSLSKEEALQILAEADKEGLVHSVRNVQQGVDYICNCCSCCCGILRGLGEFGSLNAIDRSPFFAVVDEDLCSGCETCIDRCQFKAISVGGGVCRIDRARCFGCGLCVTSCPEQALRLQPKESAETEPPPGTEKDWQKQRSTSRFGS